MRERAATADSAEFENEGGVRALLRRALGSNPLDAIALFVLVIAAGAILINALYRQPGPHPAPIFSVKPRPVATEPAEGVVPPMPRARPAALARRSPEPVVAPARGDRHRHRSASRKRARPCAGAARASRSDRRPDRGRRRASSRCSVRSTISATVP